MYLYHSILLEIALTGCFASLFLHNYCYFLYFPNIMTKHYYKSYIVAVILSYTHLSVCSVLLTLRAVA